MKRITTFDTCRTIGHAWFDTDATRVSRIGWYLWVKCERCGTIRKDTLNIRGDLSARSYVYPEGYGESEPVPKATHRLWMATRRSKMASDQDTQDTQDTATVTNLRRVK